MNILASRVKDPPAGLIYSYKPLERPLRGYQRFLFAEIKSQHLQRKRILQRDIAKVASVLTLTSSVDGSEDDNPARTAEVLKIRTDRLEDMNKAMQQSEHIIDACSERLKQEVIKQSTDALIRGRLEGVSTSVAGILASVCHHS